MKILTILMICIGIASGQEQQKERRGDPDADKLIQEMREIEGPVEQPPLEDKSWEFAAEWEMRKEAEKMAKLEEIQHDLGFYAILSLLLSMLSYRLRRRLMT